MTRHNIFGALLIAAALATAPAAGAQALKIGVVNFGRLLEESPQAKAAAVLHVASGPTSRSTSSWPTWPTTQTPTI